MAAKFSLTVGDTYLRTGSPRYIIQHRPHRKHLFVIVCLLVKNNVFGELFPINSSCSFASLHSCCLRVCLYVSTLC
jgi:hypothetical protein